LKYYTILISLQTDIKDGFAFVYLDGGDADGVVREFDGLDFEGRRLRVEKAKGNYNLLPFFYLSKALLTSFFFLNFSDGFICCCSRN